MHRIHKKIKRFVKGLFHMDHGDLVEADAA